MQVMFFRQHFGQFAIGMASVDEAIREHQKSLDHDGISKRFFSVTRGGLSTHPWADERAYEDRVAIVGDGFIDNLDATPRLYALYQCKNNEREIYLQADLIEHPKGLPSPERMAQDVMYNARVTDVEPEDWWPWSVKPERSVPAYFRRQLYKTMMQVDEAIGQGPVFFGKLLRR